MDKPMNKLNTISLQDIRIDDPFWNKYTELVTKEVIPYQWKTLNDQVDGAEPSHAIANFRIAAGLEEGRFYGYVFQDSDVAKWLEAVAYSLSWQPDAELEKKADETIDIIAAAQQPDGYLDTYFILNYPGQEFVNLQEGHELYCAGHMTEAAVAYYQVTGKRKLLDVCIRMADHICDVFHRPDHAAAVPGHEEIELALVRLYEATGTERYLQMARDFIDRRGQEPNYLENEDKKPGWMKIFPNMTDYSAAYSQSDRPVRMQTKAEGHAVRAVYLYCAMADVACHTHDEGLLKTCETLWENIVTRQMYITGGIGSSGILERFTTDYHLPNEAAYAESCASIGLALFCRRMSQITHDARYMETAETALYNTVIAGIAMDGKSFFYVNPLAVWPAACMKQTSLEHVKPVRQAWFGCACCPPNIARTLASLGEYCCFTGEDSLWINLFVSGRIHFTLGGQDFAMQVRTAFPFDGHVRMQLETDGGRTAGGRIMIRVPSYAHDFEITVDGEKRETAVEKGYAVLEGPFGAETIDVQMTVPAEFVHADPRLRADEGRVAMRKGPVIYCLEEADNGANLEQILADTSAPVMEEYRSDLLEGTMIIHAEGCRGDVEGLPDGALYGTGRTVYRPAELTFIPYAYWDNRKTGEMQVWTRERMH
jgi:DUF1680 family protein